MRRCQCQSATGEDTILKSHLYNKTPQDRLCSSCPYQTAMAIRACAQFHEVARLIRLQEALGFKSAFARVCSICAYARRFLALRRNVARKEQKIAIPLFISNCMWSQIHSEVS